MIIQSKNVWINEQFQPAQVEVSEQRIVAILPYNEKAVDKEYGENRILPGFIDIHDHGWHGGDANHANHEFIKEWQAYLPEEGITAFLPTTSFRFISVPLFMYMLLLNYLYSTNRYFFLPRLSTVNPSSSLSLASTTYSKSVTLSPFT